MRPEAEHRAACPILGSRRPFLTRREHALVVVSILILQALTNAGYTLYAAIDGHAPTLADLPAEFAIYIWACVLWYLMFRAVAPTLRSSLRVRVAAAALALAVAAFAFAYGISEIRSWFGLMPRVPNFQMMIGMTIWVLPMFVIWGLALLVFAYAYDVRERERLLTQTRELAQQAKLQALRYQVNPHFLYNTLNSISALILDRRNAHAEEMVLRLSSFLRSSLSTDAIDDVSLADEIKLQRIYLEIEKVRFGDWLETHIDLPERLAAARVPSFILQPLIENVVKHGLGHHDTKVRLEIRASEEHGRLIIEVINDGLASVSPKRGSGVGLRNVRERLQVRFGDTARFFAGPHPGGFLVRLEMPLVLAECR